MWPAFIFFNTCKYVSVSCCVHILVQQVKITNKQTRRFNRLGEVGFGVAVEPLLPISDESADKQFGITAFTMMLHKAATLFVKFKDG